jgi:AcrR family transcriptional regulator
MTQERGYKIVTSLELLWGGRERPKRGPKPGLSLDAIVAAAIELADAEGLEAVSMRRVAAALDVGTMSLYRYVPGKAELLDLMLDRMSDPGDTAQRVAGLDWRELMEQVARGTWRLYLEHPWLLQVNWARPALGPSSLAGVEIEMGGLEGIGLSDRERVMVMVAIDGYVVGSARRVAQERWAAEETGVSDDEFWAAQEPFLERAMSTGRYPTLARLSEDAFSAGHEELFEFGLARLLDGLEAFVAARRDPGPPPGPGA